jgi:hypothetical protein
MNKLFHFVILSNAKDLCTRRPDAQVLRPQTTRTQDDKRCIEPAGKREKE